MLLNLLLNLNAVAAELLISLIMVGIQVWGLGFGGWGLGLGVRGLGYGV